MIKGAQKRMIIVKTSDSKLFEEAHFVMRDQGSEKSGDILAEANRIILSCGMGAKKERKKVCPHLFFALFFSGGMLFGGGLALLLTCLL